MENTGLRLLDSAQKFSQFHGLNILICMLIKLNKNSFTFISLFLNIS